MNNIRELVIALGMGAFALLLPSPFARVHAEPQVIASGAYPEGLLWHSGQLFFTEMGADRVTVIRSDGPREFWRDTGCGPTSIAPYGSSAFLVNCHLGKHVVEISSGGRIGRRFLTTPNGEVFQAPNASASDGQGGVFFSDSGIFSVSAPATGRIYHLAANGKMTEVINGLKYANGVAFDSISRTLYISEHLARRIIALRLDTSHRVTASSFFADFSQHSATRSFSYALAGPDGIALRPDYLAVAEYGEGRVHLFDRTGNHLNTLKVAMPFVDTVAWDEEGNLYAGGAFSNIQPPYAGRVVRFAPAEWRIAQ